jgi:hypothetical protein
MLMAVIFPAPSFYHPKRPSEQRAPGQQEKIGELALLYPDLICCTVFAPNTTFRQVPGTWPMLWCSNLTALGSPLACTRPVCTLAGRSLLICFLSFVDTLARPRPPPKPGSSPVHDLLSLILFSSNAPAFPISHSLFPRTTCRVSHGRDF